MNASQDRQIDTNDTNDAATQLTRERLANARLRKLIDAHSRIAAAKLDLDRFLSLVTDSLLELVPAAHGSVVEWVDGDEMVYRACSGTIAHHIGLRLKRDGSLSASGVASGVVGTTQAPVTTTSTTSSTQSTTTPAAPAPVVNNDQSTAASTTETSTAGTSPALSPRADRN